MFDCQRVSLLSMFFYCLSPSFVSKGLHEMAMLHPVRGQFGIATPNGCIGCGPNDSEGTSGFDGEERFERGGVKIDEIRCSDTFFRECPLMDTYEQV